MIRYWCRNFLFVILIVAATVITNAATTYGRIHRLNGQAELAQGHVSNIQQDEAGLMWFATWNGLLRYDGHNVYKYKPIQCSDGTIDSDRIYNIKFNTEGDILCVSSDNRLFLFRPDTGKFISLTALVPEIAEAKVRSITPLKNGYTWIFFRDNTAIRLSDSDPLTDYTFYGPDNELTAEYGRIRSVKFGDNEQEWLLTERAAVCVDDGRVIPERFECVEVVGDRAYLITPDGTVVQPESGVRSDALSREGVKLLYVRTVGHHIIFATDRGIYGFDTTDGTLTRYSTVTANYLFKDSKMRVWGFSGDNNVVLIKDLDRAEALEMSAQKAPSVDRMKNPQLIMETPDGIIVLKTPAGLLSSYDPTDDSLRPVDFGTGNGYAPEEIKKFLVDTNGELWVLHTEGLDCMSFHRGIFTRSDNPSGAETRAVMIDSRGRKWTSDRAVGVSNGVKTFPITAAYTIREAPDGRIWIGTKGDGVYVLTPHEESSDDFAVSHLTRQTGIHSDSIYDVAFSGDRVFIGSYGNGVAVGCSDNGEWKFNRLRNQPSGLKVRSILPTRNDILLIGTADGLVTTDAPVAGNPQWYINKYRPEPEGLKGNDVMGVVECRGDYYVCVYGSGLSRIDSDNLLSDSLKFTTFTLPPAANADQIMSAASADGEIWIVTASALTRFSPQTGRMATFKPDNFAGSLTFSEAVPAIGGGRIIAGTSDGILTVRTDELPEARDPGRVSVTGIMYQNDMNIHPLNSPDEITLDPSQRSFSLLLSTAEYDELSSPNIRYRLEGHDDGWTYAGASRPVVTYSNLQPGRYSLSVEIETSKGWTDAGTRLIIKVTPRFTETILFSLTMTALTVLLIVGLAAAVVYFMKMRNALQKKYSLLMTVGRISDHLDAEAASREQAADEEERRKKFIEDSLGFVDDNIANTELVVEDLARHLGMSRTAYYNMMKETTGLAPVDFIRQIRIKRALKYLAMNQYSISEIAYMVGFSDPKYFSRCFKAEMAMTPTQYVEQNRPETQTTILP